MYRTARRAALCPLSGIPTVRPPKGGWRRDDPGTGGDGSSGHGNDGGGGSNDGGDDAGKDVEKKPSIKGDFDPDRAAAAIASARDGEKKAKQAAKDSSDKLAGVLKVLGIGSDGKADPEEQIRQLASENAELKKEQAAARVEKAIRSAAKTHTADADELLDSQRFLGQLKDLDSTASDYGDKVAKLVAQAVKDNPAKYGTATAKGGTTRSGSGDHTGGGHGQSRSKDLSSAVARKLAG